jgi:hypothetical protein
VRPGATPRNNFDRAGLRSIRAQGSSVADDVLDNDVDSIYRASVCAPTRALTRERTVQTYGGVVGLTRGSWPAPARSWGCGSRATGPRAATTACRADHGTGSLLRRSGSARRESGDARVADSQSREMTVRRLRGGTAGVVAFWGGRRSARRSRPDREEHDGRLRRPPPAQSWPSTAWRLSVSSPTTTGATSYCW